MPRFAHAGVFVGALLVTAAWATEPVAGSLEDSIAGVNHRFGPDGEGYLPGLSSGEIAQLATGETVIRNVDTGAAEDDEIGSMGVYGWRVVAEPRLQVWLATMGGGGGERHRRYTAAVLVRLQSGGYQRYQHIDLPWPFVDRHWVIETRKDLDIARKSKGQVWSHTWSLAEGGEELVESAYEQGMIPRLSRRDIDHSLYLPANRGAWVMIELSAGETLVFAHFDADLGGLFPANLVRSYTASRLRDGLAQVEEVSRDADQHYTADPPVHDGLGQPIKATKVGSTTLHRRVD